MFRPVLDPMFPGPAEPCLPDLIAPDLLAMMPRPPADEREVTGTEFRQLRHQTKNALQRLMCEVWRSAEAQTSPRERRVFEDLQRRLCLSAEVSDALFGFTAAPGSIGERLRGLCGSLLQLLGDAGQTIHLDVSVIGDCPAALEETVLRVAHEMVCNAIKHGMHARLLGRIEVALSSDGSRTRLVISDDGWGFGAVSGQGQGLTLMHELSGQQGGTVLLRRRADVTYAELDLPYGDGAAA